MICGFKKCSRKATVVDNAKPYCREHHRMAVASRAANTRRPKVYVTKAGVKGRPVRGVPKARRPKKYGANMFTPARFSGLSGGKGRP
jgi:hypothetical protein